MALCFGKRPPRIDARTLSLEKYTAALPPPPTYSDWSRGFDIDWRMYLNDSLGDCTEAKKAHAVQVWTLCNGRKIDVTDDVVLQAYEKDAGYIPGNPSTDNGEVMLDNLNAWRKNGFGGAVLTAFAAINFSSFANVAQAIYLFGLVDIGFNVPQSAMDQFNAGQPWDVVANDGGIVGGHDVVVPAYHTSGDMFTCITWGRRQKLTWNFFARYVDESYALLSPDWLSHGSVDPSGFDMATLQADLAAVTA